MMDKIEVNGDGAEPLYKWLKQQAQIDAIKWNFGTYFLIGRQGEYLEALSGVPRKFSDSLDGHLGGGSPLKSGVSASSEEAGTAGAGKSTPSMKKAPAMKKAASPKAKVMKSSAAVMKSVMKKTK
ncbi:unnamed protein product [Amoebophrya sp. A25]|nr:unnamed protein product [Amoebophrya sp. A25]|eukprot:GSA25T00005881001.1